MHKLAMTTFDRFRDQGLLLIRVGLGIMFMGHGLPKMMGGPEKWAKVGGAMKHLGLDFAPEFWGFMAASAELVGGLLLAVGFMTRPALALLFITMVVAATKHLATGDAFFKGASHAVEAAIVFAGLFLIGPGKLSFDHKLFGDGEDE